MAAVPLGHALARVVARTAPLPKWVQGGVALSMVAGCFAIADVTTPLWPSGGVPFLLLFLSILTATLLFPRGAGYLTAATSALAAAWNLPPDGSFAIEEWYHLGTLGVFVATGGAVVLAVESLHNALDRARAAERGRLLALKEYRHRSRNDLQSLVGLIMLRSRGASDETKAALREAAGHALALSAVHSSLAASATDEGAGVVDTADLVAGICRGIEATHMRDGVTVGRVLVHAEPHHLSAERGVSFGLLLHWCVSLALRCAYGGGPGLVRVEFSRHAQVYRLVVEDHGSGLPASARGSLGARMLRAQAAQLRGEFSRGPADGGGTRCVLVFPTPEPGA